MGGRSSGDPTKGSASGSSDASHLSRQTSSYNRVRVQDLLNDEGSSSSRHPPHRGSSSHTEYECETPHCGRKFQSKSSLSAHKRQCKAAPTPFVCARCQTSFSSNANLNKHIRTVHDKVKPYSCNHCGANFAFRDGRERHVRMVHDQLRPFTCSICSIKFKTRSHLKKHVIARHPGSPLPPDGNERVGTPVGSSARGR